MRPHKNRGMDRRLAIWAILPLLVSFFVLVLYLWADLIDPEISGTSRAANPTEASGNSSDSPGRNGADTTGTFWTAGVVSVDDDGARHLDRAHTPVPAARVDARSRSNRDSRITAVADSQGVFTLRFEDADEHVIMIRAAGHRTRIIRVDPTGELPATVPLQRDTLPDGSFLSGTVFDASTMTPLEGATVQVAGFPEGIAWTDYQGAFRVDVSRMTEDPLGWDLKVEHLGYMMTRMSSRGEQSPGPLPGEHVLILLFPSIRLAGRVVSQSGRPIPGASLEIHDCSHVPSHVLIPDAISPIPDDRQSVVIPAVPIDAQGKYEAILPARLEDFFLVGSAPAMAMAVSPCLGTVNPDKTDLRWDFILSEGITLTGRVRTEAGEGVAGAEVRAHIYEDRDPSVRNWTSRFSALVSRTNEDGAFRIGGIPPGRSLWLTVWPEDNRVGRLDDSIDVVDPNVPIEVVLRRPRNGELVVFTDAPRDSQTIKLYAVQGTSDYGLNHYTGWSREMEQGRYFAFGYTKEGATFSPQWVDIREGEQTRLQTMWSAWNVIDGQLVDSSGNAVAGQEIAVSAYVPERGWTRLHYPERDDALANPKTDLNGRFEIGVPLLTVRVKSIELGLDSGPISADSPGRHSAGIFTVQR